MSKEEPKINMCPWCGNNNCGIQHNKKINTYQVVCHVAGTGFICACGALGPVSDSAREAVASWNKVALDYRPPDR